MKTCLPNITCYNENSGVPTVPLLCDNPWEVLVVRLGGTLKAMAKSNLQQPYNDHPMGRVLVVRLGGTLKAMAKPNLQQPYNDQMTPLQLYEWAHSIIHNLNFDF
jgi:hypothetical protein